MSNNKTPIVVVIIAGIFGLVEVALGGVLYNLENILVMLNVRETRQIEKKPSIIWSKENCTEIVCFDLVECDYISGNPRCELNVHNKLRQDSYISIESADLISSNNHMNEEKDIYFGGNLRTSSVSIPAETELSFSIEFPAFKDTSDLRKLRVIAAMGEDELNIQCSIRRQKCRVL